MTVFNAVQCARGSGTLMVGLVLVVSIARSSVSYHIKILECVSGMLTQ